MTLRCYVEDYDNSSLQWSNPAQQTLYFGEKRGRILIPWPRVERGKTQARSREKWLNAVIISGAWCTTSLSFGLSIFVSNLIRVKHLQCFPFPKKLHYKAVSSEPL